MAVNRKLLIVDDDPGIRNQMKWGFDGFDIITAEDRENALKQFSKHHPAVVTLDLGMPPDEEGCNEGFTALRQILEKAPETKIIVVSASDDPLNAKRAVDSGAFEYSAKPVNIKNLTEILERAYRAYETSKK